MEKNMMILLLVVLVVIVIAVVMMMSGGGGPAPVPGPGPSCGDGTCQPTESCSTCAADCGACAGPPGPTPPSCGDGTCQSTESCSTCAADCGACTGPPVLPGIDFTAPVECTITTVTENGNVVMDIKAELPKYRGTLKLQNMEMPMAPQTILTSDGVTVYSNIGGNQWIKIDMSQYMDRDVEATYHEPPEGVTINCWPTGDIPDSEFQLPPGAQVMDMGQLPTMGELPEGFELPEGIDMSFFT